MGQAVAVGRAKPGHHIGYNLTPLEGLLVFPMTSGLYEYIPNLEFATFKCITPPSVSVTANHPVPHKVNKAIKLPCLCVDQKYIFLHEKVSATFQQGVTPLG